MPFDTHSTVLDRNPPSKIRIGSRVSTKHGIAKVTNIELCEKPGEKYGIKMKEIWISLKDQCIFDLDNNHFAYGDELEVL
tara:strand:+ start:4156 stop:4395 length:240 start_codon:yes stop_codon:yes gene_type:complete